MPTAKHPDDAPPVPPVRPDNDECCHSGCEPCIFDLYELEMDRYRLALKAWEKRMEDGKSRKKISRKAALKPM
ncbi:oxidoreductase-like domain-containing protein [Herminiimonas arsenitoxidans]|uniref:oxidoreductase-like domain-containing protein n=1 Tax=Herminiimonas arsenitoxidans TaxID=1809410 RepID=UPI0009703E3A|nr:oxidoreductase-like domain-containing protein [Herminiimonas arsenitoxidans]